MVDRRFGSGDEPSSGFGYTRGGALYSESYEDLKLTYWVFFIGVRRQKLLE